MKHKTALEIFCSLLGWQGGTIHQVAEELRSRGICKEYCDTAFLLKCKEHHAKLLIALCKEKQS